MLTLLVQLLFLMLLLIMIGEPLRALFFRRLKLFADLDFAQICLLDIYLGGLILYIIAMLPLQLFSSSVVLGVTVFGIVSTIFIHFRNTLHSKTRKTQTSLPEKKKAIVDYAFLFAIFLVFLSIQLVPLNNFVFGSVHDTSLHSLMVEVILENHYVPVTLQPYLPEGIIYPQGAHVIFAYAAYVLSFEAPKAVFYVTPLFNSLSVLGAYFLGKKLRPDRSFYLGLSFVFAFVSTWPLYVTWGGNSFVTGFPLFLLCLGLFASFTRSREKIDSKELIAVGVLFGYSAAIIISYLQTLMVMGALWLVYSYARKSDHSRGLWKKLFLIFGVSMLPLSPFLSRFIMFYQNPGHNLGIPADFSGYVKQQVSLTQAIEWAFENLSPYLVLRLEFIFLFASLGILLWKIKNDENIKRVLLFVGTMFLASTLLSFASYFQSAEFGVVSWGHQGIIFTIPISILIVIFYLKLPHLFNRFNLEWSSKIFSKHSHAVFLISVISLTAINAPFIYYRLVADRETLTGIYGLYAITTPDDYQLMLWMKDNLPNDAIVLVNPNEAGLFVPSTALRKAVFPYVGSQLSSSYKRLVSLLQQHVLNQTTYELMQLHGISYIYVGADATYWWTGNVKWNYQSFLGNPNFELVKNVNDAYLFKLSHYDSHMIFLDDFTHESLYYMRWRNQSDGSGFGNATITLMSEKPVLLINSTKMTEENWFYVFWVYREIYAWDPANVTLTFSLNTIDGFNNVDDMAFVITNEAFNRSLTIAVNDNGFFWLCNPNPNVTIRTGSSEGTFSFNLSTLWQRAYNSTLPSPFILEIMSFDADGVTNTAYIDFVKVAYGEG